MITIQQISNYTALDTAFKTISGKSQTPGLDGISPVDFGRDAVRNLKELSWAIQAGVYEPSDLKRWELERNGKKRKMGILTCSDRIVATLFSRALLKKLDASFIENCFAYRPGKSALEAISVTAASIQSGWTYFLRLDIEDYFGSIDHDLLIEKIAPHFDSDTLELVSAFIEKSGSNHRGLVLGSPLSPILSNIFLMDLDRMAEKEIDGVYLRYADDLLILTNDETALLKAEECIVNALKSLKLQTNAAKTFKGKIAEGFDFLGFHIDHQGMKASNHAEEALNDMLQQEWESSKDLSPVERMVGLLRRFNGWKGYYQNKITGGHLGVAALIYEGKTDPEEILAYRRGLPYDDFSMISLLAALWSFRNQRLPALEEYEGFLGIVHQPESLDDETVGLLLQGYKSLFQQWNNEAIVNLAMCYSRKGMYLQADELSKHMVNADDSDHHSDELQFGYDEESIQTFRKLFFSNRNAFATECLVQDERRFVRHENNVTRDDLKRHLAGEITLNTFCTDAEYSADFLVFDIDIEKSFLLTHQDFPYEMKHQTELADQYAVNLIKLIHNYGGTAYLEDSGGYGRHVWIFFNEPVQYLKAAEMGASLLEKAETLPEGLVVELFPPCRKIKVGQEPPTIKVPFGKNVRTLKRSTMRAEDGRLFKNWANACDQLAKSDIHALIKNVGKVKRLEQSNGPINDDYERLGNLTVNVEQIIMNCAIMRRLCLKAHDTKFLNHFERLSLLYVFGHLGKEGQNFLHQIMKKTMDYNPKTTDYFIGKCPKSPVGCAKLRNELMGLGCKNCKCDFVIPKGCYASPVLHAVDRVTYGVEDQNITLPVVISGNKEAVVDYFDNQNQIESRVESLIHLSEEIKKMEKQRNMTKFELIDLICETGSEKIMTPFGVLKINDHNELTIVLE